MSNVQLITAVATTEQKRQMMRVSMQQRLASSCQSPDEMIDDGHYK